MSANAAATTATTTVNTSAVPFLDLQAQYQSIKHEVDAAIRRVINSADFVLGREVAGFEEAFAHYIGAGFCIGVSSGTAAIQLAVMACGIGPGDEVIVPVNSFFATAEAVSTANATPVFVDADNTAYTIDIAQIEAAITKRTRAIMPVHLYGQAADLDPIFDIAKRRNLAVIEDAAQAHGGEYKGRRVGALGQAGCFSFYPGKNLGAYGEGGAVVTDDPEIARRIRLLRDHGAEQKYHHEVIGYNFRLEGLQAAVLNVKLPRLDSWNNLRRQAAARYTELLSPGSDNNHAGLITPREMPYARHVFHLYVVQSAERDLLQKTLSERGIATGIHYPVPIHLQPAYAALGHKPGDFPHAEGQSRRVLSLPMFAELTDQQIKRVVDACGIHASSAQQQCVEAFG